MQYMRVMFKLWSVCWAGGSKSNINKCNSGLVPDWVWLPIVQTSQTSSSLDWPADNSISSWRSRWNRHACLSYLDWYLENLQPWTEEKPGGKMKSYSGPLQHITVTCVAIHYVGFRFPPSHKVHYNRFQIRDEGSIRHWNELDQHC